MMTHRTFDWRANPDERSRLHLVSAAESTRNHRYWRTGPILDQQSEGACVGHGVVGAIVSSPIRVALPHPQQTAFGMYYGSRRIDQWPGEDYSGTSVNAGMKLARELGLISEWEWADGIARLRNTVLEEGCVVTGMDFDARMEDPDSQGLVDIGGGVLGGHCMFITGYSRRRAFDRYTGPVFQLANSWGPGWGRRGYLYMREADVEVKFAEGAEFAIPRR
jgi:hypothetical protein